MTETSTATDRDALRAQVVEFEAMEAAAERAERDAAAIVRIVAIVDTREWVEDEERDRWIPVPGTGDARDCDRCGRLHEIHATVETADGGLAVVGVGCAKGESVEKPLRSAASSAKTLARLRAQLAAAKQTAEREADIRAEVAALRFPDERVTKGRVDGASIETREVDGVSVWLHGLDDIDRVMDTLRDSWRRREMHKRGLKSHRSIAAEVADIENRIARSESRIDEITHPNAGESTSTAPASESAGRS